MKLKTPFQIDRFLTISQNDFAYAGQISDHPLFQAKIGRIVVIEKYTVDHSSKRMQFYGYLIHVDLTSMQVVKSFNGEINNWILSNYFKTVVRSVDGFTQLNNDFVPKKNREEGVVYSDSELQEFQTLPAFDRFSKMFKDFNLPTSTLIGKIIEISDKFDEIFDVYGDIQNYLHTKELNFENPTL